MYVSSFYNKILSSSGAQEIIDELMCYCSSISMFVSP